MVLDSADLNVSRLKHQLTGPPAVSMGAGKRRLEVETGEKSLDVEDVGGAATSEAAASTLDAGEAIVDSVTDSLICLHDVSYPEGYGEPQNMDMGKVGKEAAREYPFVLDPFQKKAIQCLEAGDSVLVSAHTSAGKTVVAEYAIAMSLRDNQKVIYTSPIKALSNQKYRELHEEFSDVGLMTGDVTISPNASCLVMTTEILRSMQYRGSEVMREVAWIIFDEVHYMRDRERGVVWEESIVMAPKNARFVFLSATVPNAKEFADWVAKVHQQPCHIVYTDFRPTPLQHFIFPAGGDGLYLVVDEKSTFREENFQKAVNAVAPTALVKKERLQKRSKASEPGEGSSDIFKLAKMIMLRQYDPVIVFSFSKRDCERLANEMVKLDLTGDDEKKLVDGIFWNALDFLSDDDKKLPQVALLLPLLRRGIGVHHSGLLPVLKEIIEILFQEGLIRCLFATETFSIGLNMPAKTVVFTNVRKFDGDKFRWLSSGEYIQMSGRAGRRGIDDRGICILMLDEKLEPAVAKAMIKGHPDPLNSAFHLSYSMLLNQMRCEESDPETLLRHSFHQFQLDRALPRLQFEARKLEAERDSIVIEEEDQVHDYYTLVRQYRQHKSSIRNIVFSPGYCLPFLQPGRLVRILKPMLDGEVDVVAKDAPAVWGVIINFEKAPGLAEDFTGGDEEQKKQRPQYVVDVLTNCTNGRGAGRKKTVQIVSLDEVGEPMVVAVSLSQLDCLSAVRTVVPKDLVAIEARHRALKSLSDILKRFPDGVQLLDPEEDMQVRSAAYRKAVRQVEAIEGLLADHSLADSPTLAQRLKMIKRKEELLQAISVARKETKTASALVFKEELKARKRTLRRLGYTTAEGVVELKGRVACEIRSADELILTELLFSGAFKEATVEEVVAVLSCLVWQEKTKGFTKLREDLQRLYSQLKEIARRVGNVQFESKLEIDVEEYVASFRPDIMEIVHSWGQGAKFLEIMRMSDKIFEGSLIRALKRLEEVLQQLMSASRTMGEVDLEAKFQDASTKIKRDIVFAGSLYL